MRHNKNIGFTLIETVLAVGLIAVLTIGIYQRYNKKYSEQSGNLQAERLYMLNKNIDNLLKNQDLSSSADQNATVSIINTKILNTSNLSNLNSAGVIPEGMYDDKSKSIMAIGGSPLLVTANVLKVGDASFITLNNNLTLTKGECSSLLGSPLIWRQTIKISSGSTIIKNTDGSVNFTNLTNVCNGTAAIDLYYPLTQPKLKDVTVCENCGSARDKEQKYHIATNSNIAKPGSATSECAKVGGSWNNTTSTCVCGLSAAGSPQQWNGSQCVEIWYKNNSNNNGFCPLGYGWKRENPLKEKCVQLEPNSGASRIKDYLETEQTNKITGTKYKPNAIISSPNTCNLDGGSGCPAPKYTPNDFATSPPISTSNNETDAYWKDSGRLIPSNIGFQTAGGANSKIGDFSLSSMPKAETTDLTKVDKLVLPKYAVIPKNDKDQTPIGGVEGKRYTICVQNGATWDGDRCVTPITNNVSDIVKESVRLDSCRRNKTC